ncbi:CocE/NonD family hydrolase [Actinokineospora enzanensis]|uniref:CocE/NonD family hydrolase n=1 Tax=Actinokineospora enzanensis TaxID=155975 RepID=UPI00037AA660|nr:CocE/NonD family hydrolase [Actinokineospora enzanensis]
MSGSTAPPVLPSPEPLTVPMGDGAVLSALRYPAGTGPAPVVVLITPYRKESMQHFPLLNLILSTGCHAVVADVRGFGGSTGPYYGVLSEREITDGVELLEWIAQQPFCENGTALAGGSYSGINQLLIAARRPKGLRCLAPWIAPTDTYRDMWKRGGIPSHTAWGARTLLSSQHRETRREGLRYFYLGLLEEDLDTAPFQQADLSAIAAPALFLGGWTDYFLRGSVRGFQQCAAPKRLVVGNWSHEPFVPKELGAELAAWFRHWLFGEGPDPTRPAANVALSRLDSDEWITLPGLPEPEWARWSPVREPVTRPVCVDLSCAPPAGPTDVSLMVDLSTDSGMRLWGESVTFDLPITEPTRLLGQVGLTLVSIVDNLVSGVDNCVDFDLHARVSVVDVDGAARQITEGRLRAAHRALDLDRSTVTPAGDVAIPWHPHTAADPVPPGEPVTLHVEIYPVHLLLRPGESLRLGLTAVRADESAEPARITLLPDTLVVLPVLGAPR